MTSWNLNCLSILTLDVNQPSENGRGQDGECSGDKKRGLVPYPRCPWDESPEGLKTLSCLGNCSRGKWAVEIHKYATCANCFLKTPSVKEGGRGGLPIMTFTTIIKAQPDFKVQKKSSNAAIKTIVRVKKNVAIKVFILTYLTSVLICNGLFKYTPL